MLKNDNDIILILIFGTILLFILSLIIIVAIVTYNTKQRKLRLENHLLQSQFSQTLLQSQLEIQEQTLTTISQEIHDNIGQILSLAKLHLNTLLPIENEQQQLQITETKNLVSKAIVDLRNLSRSMHGHYLEEIGLQQAITNELTIIENTGQFITDIVTSGDVYKLPPQKEIVLFRITQEAINNCIKHSKANKIQVSLNFNENNFTICIHDNGNGFDVFQKKNIGLGLKNMQSRAANIGAVYTIDTAINNGTLIKIYLPIKN